MLPPGASLPSVQPAAALEVSNPLPTGAAAAPAVAVTRPSRADKAAALLPPGATLAAPSATAGEAEVAVPVAPARFPRAEPVSAGTIAVQDSPRVIRSGDEEVEVRRLSAEEKSRRRFRKSLILWTICLLVLIAVFYYFTR
jgi:hypothetical protein